MPLLNNGPATIRCGHCDYYKVTTQKAIKIIRRLHDRVCPKTGRSEAAEEEYRAAMHAKAAAQKPIRQRQAVRAERAIDARGISPMLVTHQGALVTRVLQEVTIAEYTSEGTLRTVECLTPMEWKRMDEVLEDKRTAA